jgi:hypothetical protein
MVTAENFSTEAASTSNRCPFKEKMEHSEVEDILVHASG